MNRHAVPIAIVAVALASVLSAKEDTWTFNGGKARLEAGGIVVEQGNRTLSIDACFVAKGWGFQTIKDAIKGVSCDDGALRIAFKAVSPSDAKWQNDLPMLIIVKGDASDYSKDRLRMGAAIASFDKTNVWGYGKSLESETFGYLMSVGTAMSMSFWNNTSKKLWSVRFHTKGSKQPDGSTLYEEALTISKKKITIPRPVDMVAQKRTQYGRVLYPPQEKGFNPDAWIAKIESPDMKRGEFGLVEDLFDARSRLYSAADRLRCRPGRDADGEELVKRGYDALNHMDHAAATNACAAIEARLAGSAEWMPYGTFNPFNWVKCFTQWGYMRHPDGCSVSEPNPWLVMWQDGFRLNLAQDERVAIANTASNPQFYETRYLKPMTDVKFERSWVDTRWILPDRTVTFSLLTPMIDVDGVETFTLSGLPSEPLRLRWVTPSGRMGVIQLVSAPPVEPEVVASALMDFKAPPPPPRAWARGEQKIDPDSVNRPFLFLVGRDWQLALFPGARPVAATWMKGVFSLKLQKRSWVGVLRLRDNLHEWEQPEVCEFFAPTALAYPSACRATMDGGKGTWKYTYRMRESAWNERPRLIAPVPPLLDYAEVPVAGSRRFKYPTKWGSFRYCDGDAVACRLPELPREPRLRGVNVGIWDSDAAWEGHATNGAHWVRAVFGGKRPLDEHIAQLELRLRQYGKRMKFLVDPHCKEYKVPWDSGLAPSNDVVFVELWDRISRVCAKHAEAIEGYDLYNEPGIVAGSEARWRMLCERVARTIHANHPGAKIYYSAIYGGNPNGLLNLVPMSADCEPQTITYHFYSPHAFSHQKHGTHNAGGDTCVFYPAWAAPIDWKAGTHFGGTTVDWYDRWTLAAILLPVYEHYAAHRKPLHVGEYSIIGYANQKSPWSAFLWTRDATELIESNGASWHLWNGGFGLGNPFVREYIHGLWR